MTCYINCATKECAKPKHTSATMKIEEETWYHGMHTSTNSMLDPSTEINSYNVT